MAMWANAHQRNYSICQNHGKIKSLVMNIRIAQINPIVGDIDGNSELIRKTIISSPDDSIVEHQRVQIASYHFNKRNGPFSSKS